MAVADRWHTRKPRLDEDGNPVPKCREHRLYPSLDHGQGDRWQVRYRDEHSRQKKRNFAKRQGTDPEKCADAFDAKVRTQLDDGSYIDPASANTLFQKVAEDWRKNRIHDESTAIRVEYEFRLHVYADPATPGRTPRGGPALGHLTMRQLEKRPSFCQAWISGLSLSPSSAQKVIRNVSSVFISAQDDGLISRNPLRAQSVTRPKATKYKAVPWPLEWVEAMTEALRHENACKALHGCACEPSAYQVIPTLGSGSGLRRGEMFGLAVGNDAGVDDDVDFLRRVIRVRRQVKVIRGKQVFAPLKNGTPHEVPLSDSLAVALSEHIKTFPPVAVTLPWKSADGDPVAFKLLLTRPNGLAMHPKMADDRWHAALARAGIEVSRRNMFHVLRHTAASAWLSAGISVAAVAEFLGDTVETVLAYYSHFIPDDSDRARRAMDQFFTKVAVEPSALNVPSEATS